MSDVAAAQPIRLVASLGIDALLAVASSSHGPEGHYGLPKRGVHGDESHDHLRDASAATEFLRARHEFNAPAERLDARALATLRQIRGATQALARGRDRSYRQALARLLARSAFAIDADGTVRAVANGWSGMATALLLPLLALHDAGKQLKVCGNPRCQWLFVDRSRNRSRIWCDPAACGNRLGVRRFRARTRRAVARAMQPRRKGSSNVDHADTATARPAASSPRRASARRA